MRVEKEKVHPWGGTRVEVEYLKDPHEDECNEEAADALGLDMPADAGPREDADSDSPAGPGPSMAAAAAAGGSAAAAAAAGGSAGAQQQLENVSDELSEPMSEDESDLDTGNADDDVVAAADKAALAEIKHYQDSSHKLLSRKAFAHIAKMCCSSLVRAEA